MDIYAFLIGRVVLLAVFFVSLRVIGLTYTQALFLVFIMASLMMVRLFPVVTRGVIGLAFVWSIAIAMNIAPSYTALNTHNFKSLESISQIDFANVVRNGFSKEPADGSNHLNQDETGIHGDYEQQIHAVDLLVKSGALKKEYADRIKEEIGREKASGQAEMSAATPK